MLLLVVYGRSRWIGRAEGDAFNGEHRFLIEPVEKITIKCTLLKVKNLQAQWLRHLKDGLIRLSGRILKT
jgi:hypothetical protein